MNQIKKSILGALFISLFTQTTPVKAKNPVVQLAKVLLYHGGLFYAVGGSLELLKKTPKKDLCKDIALAYALGLCTLTAHEFGHGITHKALFGGTFTINVGFNPLAGSCSFSGETRSNTKTDHLKDIAVSAAGPIFGAASNFAIYKFLEKKYPNPQDFHFTKTYCKAAAIGNLCQLIPFRLDFDGWGIENWRDGVRILENIKKYRQCSA